LATDAVNETHVFFGLVRRLILFLSEFKRASRLEFFCLVDNPLAVPWIHAYTLAALASLRIVNIIQISKKALNLNGVALSSALVVVFAIENEYENKQNRTEQVKLLHYDKLN